MTDAELNRMIEMESEGLAETECPEGCVVEPDGTCPHGFDSLLLINGLI